MGAATAILFTVMGLEVLQARGTDDGKTLQMVHVVMRHGIRTPASTYPNDPYINETFFPVGWGQITNDGKLQLYNVGIFFRQRYGEFLGPLYYPKEYYTQSTGVDRTKVSMQMVNAGLWPPAPDQKWGPLEWQPIPITSEPLDEDSLLLVRKPCPQYHIEKEKIMNSPVVKEMMEKYEDLFKELSEITGQNINNFDDVQDIYSTLLAEEAYNLTLPDWTKTYFPDILYFPTVKSYVLNVFNDKLNRLRGGYGFRDIEELRTKWTHCYRLECGKCSAVYTGQTSRNFREHVCLDRKSAMYEHLQESKHKISEDNLKILHTCNKGKKMNLLEAMEINKSIQNPKYKILNEQLDLCVLLKKLISDWTSKIEGTIVPKERKFILYGGHDSTIVNVLNALGVWDEQLPGFAITALFELYKDDVTNDYGVKIYLRNSTNAPPFELTIPGCNSFCPLATLKQLTKKVVPENWKEECKTDDENFVVPELGGP